MYNQGTHIVTRCQWNTTFDAKNLAYQLQSDISSWSSYKMKRVINHVFDTICPDGQTLKISKLAIDLGTITYENMWSELPLRLEEALRNALHDMIMYPKNGDTTLEIVNEAMAQINVLRTFLLEGMMPWNYQETYGTAHQIMQSQLVHNRLDVIEMLQEIGSQKNVRKRIAWQFTDITIKKIITGLEPNNHQQIISFSEEFVKVQEKEAIVQTTTNDLKKNIWLWILNYLFTDRGTIFNNVAFVQNTVEQMANHFNLSYESMLELIESAVNRINQYSQVNKGFIAILKLVSAALHQTTFRQIKTVQQKENLWLKVTDYLNEPTKRSTHKAKNELNELVINLSKLDAKRFQKIVLHLEQKSTPWKPILKDLIPAAIENLFIAVSPSLSKNVLTQISFLSKVNTTTSFKVNPLDLYTYGIEFCVAHQHRSVSKDAFLTYTIQKLAKQQSLTKLAILEYFTTANVTNTAKKISFISLYNELHTLYQNEISITKIGTSEETLQQISIQYISDIQVGKTHSKKFKTLEKTIQQWILTSPNTFWEKITNVQKTPKAIHHITALIAQYGTERFFKKVAPSAFTILEKVQQIIDQLIAKNAKKASTLRVIKSLLVEKGIEVALENKNVNSVNFFTQLLQTLKASSTTSNVANTDFTEAIQLLLADPKTKTLSWTSQEFAVIRKQYKILETQTPITEILAMVQQPNQEVIVANRVSKLVRTKKINTIEFKTHEKRIISYLLSNGIQVRERLIFKFLKQISATETAFSSSQMKVILNDCFWQTLVLHEGYRGNERRFVKLFQETVQETFPTLQTTAKKTMVAAQTKSFATPYKLSIAVVFDALNNHLKTGKSSIQIEKKTYSYAELFLVGLETSPTKIRTMIRENLQTEKQQKLVREAIHFEEFIVLIASDVSTAQQAIFKAIHQVFILAKQLGNAQIMTALEAIFWKQTMAIIQGKNTPTKVLNILVKSTFDQLSEVETLDQITIVKHIQNSGLKITEVLKKVLIQRHQIFELVSGDVEKVTFSEAIITCIANGKMELLSKYLITQYTIPAWFQHKKSVDYQSVVNEILAQQPLVFLKTIRDERISSIQLTKLSQTIHFSILVKSLHKLYPTQQKQLLDVQKLYELIALVSISGISTKNLQEILVNKVLTAWQTANWKLIANTNIWNEFLWEICTKKGVKEPHFFKGIQTIKTLLPTSLLVTYKSIVPAVKTSVQIPKTITTKNPIKSLMNTTSEKLCAEGISVPNAGLVLLNNYFLMLMERLGILADKAFKTENDQLNAVHYFQYIVTGLTQTDESLLVLNKVLSGLSPDTPVRDRIEMTEDEKKLIDGLIQAVIGHWPTIGNTSINGFRGNWLVREGILRETEDRWELTVEKRAYDILLMKSPFSFSIIKLPWMQKPLHVTWTY